MAPELRSAYHRELERLDISLGALLSLIPDAITSATAALVADDASIGTELQRWRALIEDLYADVEKTASSLIARQAPVASDLRFLFACVRIVPFLNDTIDLVAEIAAPAGRLAIGTLPDRLLGLIAELGSTTTTAWTAVVDLWENRDAAHVAAVNRRDDLIADVRSSLVAEVSDGSVGVPVAMDVALLGRAYERLGHNAALAARRITPLVATPQGGAAQSGHPDPAVGPGEAAGHVE